MADGTKTLPRPADDRRGGNGDEGFAAEPPRSRRLARPALILLAVGVAVGITWLVLGGDSDSDTPTAQAASASALVSRRDLIDRDTFTGTLGYADTRTLSSGLSGTVTGIRREGDVARRGEPLYRVDGRPVPLLYGWFPLWRTIDYGVEGRDVLQLEQNLVALGYDSGRDIDVNQEYDWATRAAIRRWQDDLGVTVDGTVDPGEAVFLSGPRRIGELSASIGSRVGEGAPVMQTSSSRRQVTVKLDARRQTLVAKGQEVEVELPDGSTVQGRIASVGKVATSSGDENSTPTIDVKIALQKGADAGNLDQAPVDVGIARETKKGVLSVPVSALLALAGGGFAVEVVQPDGSRKLLAVDPGLFANGLVEISGTGIRAGLKVVVPR